MIARSNVMPLGTATMTETTLYRLMLLIPPIVHGLVVVITQSDVVLASLIYGGIPYFAWAVALLVWMHQKPVRRIRRAVLFAPLTFFPFLLAFVLVGGLVLDTSEAGREIPALVLTSAPLWLMVSLIFGYFWVALTVALRGLLGKIGVLRQTTHQV
jgi:small-conductance mechanosensitive channel